MPKEEAIDGLYARQVQKIKEREQSSLAQEEAKQKEAEAKAKQEEEERAKLASMTPVERLVNSYGDVAVLINDMKNGTIENFEEIKIELAQEVKKILQQNPKTWDKAKKKALDRKVYVEGLLS